MPVEDAILVLRQSGHSRAPIVRGALDDAIRQVHLGGLIEELVEELVEEIYDETDRDLLSVHRDDDGALLLPASFPMHDLPDIGIELPPGQYATVAGLILRGLRTGGRHDGSTMDPNCPHHSDRTCRSDTAAGRGHTFVRSSFSLSDGSCPIVLSTSCWPRGIQVGDVAIHRWVQRFTLAFVASLG